MSKKSYLSIYAKSFNWAGFFLPKHTYQNCSKLYSFCRILDNIADDQDSIASKEQKFKDLKQLYLKNNSNNSIVEDMKELEKNYDISKNVINDLFDGIESDIKETVKFKSEKDLLLYSYRVAGTVGLMMAKILGVKTITSLKAAINLGVAMQLTNISRDVIEDSINNRFYIHHSMDDIKSTIKISEVFYDNSFYSIKEIPINLRFAILVARRVYRKIGRKIMKINSFEAYKNSGKIYVNNLEKVLETVYSIYDFFKLMIIKDNKATTNPKRPVASARKV
ncbi:squalene/phytoene synthase family protein [Candidatus Pelagibacter bacterium]|nr:squalene/phytoene synthase family protein [Candidatus Pelagibacter bacterium]